MLAKTISEITKTNILMNIINFKNYTININFIDI